MYFDDNNIINISEFINNKYSIYAHKRDEKNERLESHTNLCIKYFLKIVNEKYLDKIFKKLEVEFLGKFSLQSKKLFREMILNTITLHDIGKVNACFQRNRLNNDLKINECLKYNNSHHSLLSSIIYIDVYFSQIRKFKKEERNILLDFMIMNSYVISRHHGKLTSWKSFRDKFKTDEEGEKLVSSQKSLYEKTLKREISANSNYINKIFEIIQENNENYTKDQVVYRYIYERLMLSILIACDFYSTSEFMSDVEINDIGIINNIDKFYNQFKEGEIYKLIRKYEKEEYNKEKDFSNLWDINILRNEMFLDAEKVLEKNIDSNIFYLEAPTGSGKSNVATNLSFKLLKNDSTKNKIFYVYPFNTLVEQNINNLKIVFEKEENIFNKIAVINSIEPIKMDKEISESEDVNLDYYQKALLNRQFLNYPIILTTHVTIFKYLFGTFKEDIFPVHQLANSVIVLDEIQSYKNLIWGEIITFLTCYAKILNIKIIIMSATLPNLNKLSLSIGNTTKLIKNREKYFGNHVFKNRVKVDYSLLESENVIEDLFNHVKKRSYKNKKILLEFISKTSAYNFYNKLKDDDKIFCSVELMSGDDNIGERDRIIKKIKSVDSIILVATQVVEAGIDIDMDIGYKNISMLDSEEQFLGRINRSCKKSGCTVYFFRADDPTIVYKKDIRTHKDITLENETIKDILKEKNFERFYNLVIERLKELKESTRSFNELNIKQFFNKEVKNLEFKEIEDRLRLIKEQDNKISVYLSSNITIKNQNINGKVLWNDYKNMLLSNDINYSKKKVKLSQIKSKMNNFIYEVKWRDDFPYNDRLGDLYFIEDGEKYFKKGKLDKEKFISGIGEFI